MIKVGFSINDLNETNISFSNRLKLYFSLGSNAIELDFKNILNFKLTEDIIKHIKKFDYISIHAPTDNVYGKNNKTEKFLEKLKEVCRKLQIDTIVLHPDTIDNFSILEKSKLPFGIENMDKANKIGTDVGFFKKIKKKHSFGFVLDAQHAYEHDPSMKLAKKLFFIMGNRLKHMHISGSTNYLNHAPVYLSNNKDAIVKILNLGLEFPKILEGLITENISKTISEELAFVKSYEQKI